MGEDELPVLLGWLRKNVKNNAIYEFLAEDKRLKTPEGKAYLVRSIRVISDIGNEIRAQEGGPFSQGDLESIIDDYLPAFAVATSIHYDQYRKDGVTYYIEHPLTVGKEAAFSSFYREDTIPGNIFGKAKRAARRRGFKKELLWQTKFRAKLGFLHDTAEELRRMPQYEGMSPESAIDVVIGMYSKLNPKDKDTSKLREGLYYLTPSKGHFFSEIDHIMQEAPEYLKPILLTLKAYDRGHNSRNNEEDFSLANRVNNLIKNLYVVNAIKRHLHENEPQSLAINLPFSRRLTFNLPFLGPKLEPAYLPLLRGYRDLILASEDECDDIISGVATDRNEYSKGLVTRRASKAGISRDKFKDVLGSFRKGINSALGKMRDSDFLGASSRQRTYEERFGRVREMVEEAFEGKTPSDDRLRKVLYEGLPSIYSQQVKTPFKAKTKGDSPTPAEKMAELIVARADAEFLMQAFPILADNRPTYLRNFQPNRNI